MRMSWAMAWVAVLVVAIAAPAWADLYDDTANGDWSDVSTWSGSPAAAPDGDDDVTIDFHAVSFDAAAIGSQRLDLKSGGTLTLAKALGVADYTLLYGGSTLDMAGHSLATTNLYLGHSNNTPMTLSNQGSMAASGAVYLYNGFDLHMLAADRHNNVDIDGGASVTTADPSNIDGNATVGNTCTLTMGAALGGSGIDPNTVYI